MAHPHFNWSEPPELRLWQKQAEENDEEKVLLEAFGPKDNLDVMMAALEDNKVDFNGDEIPLPLNKDIAEWALETQRIMHTAKLPEGVKFYSLYGTSFDTPYHTCYRSNKTPLQELTEILNREVWIKEMAAYVKSINNKHLLTVGLEGFYKQGSQGTSSANSKHTPRSATDFIQNHQVAGIDFATVHAYPDLWMPWKSHGEKLRFFGAWMEAHVRDADEILHMPLLFLESELFDAHHLVVLYTAMYIAVYESAKQQASWLRQSADEFCAVTIDGAGDD